jgi:ABC-2 type transport system permease protein
MIRALIAKDLKLYFRNRFFLVVTLLGMGVFIGLYYLLPSKPDDTITTAIAVPPGTSVEMGAFLSDAMDSDLLSSGETLKQAVENGDYQAGTVFTEDNLAALRAGSSVTMTVYSAPGTTPVFKQALVSLYTAGFDNLNLSSGETKINVNDQIVVLGPDLLGIGQPLALRDRMLPLLLMMVFSIELMGMANLISEEGTRGTARALLVTPLKLDQLFTAKVLLGLGLAFLEALLLITAVGKLTVAPAILSVTLATGSLMLTGLAFLIAALAGGTMSVLAWSVLFLLILMLPGLSVIFPTMASTWIKAIPSYYLVDSLHRALNYSAGWGDLRLNLMILLASGVLFLLLGAAVLRRRFQ